MPRSIQPTGVWWAAAAVVLVTLAKITFGPARRSLGVALTVWDDAVLGWLAGLRLPGLTGLMEAIVASTGSAGMIGALRWATLLALLALRRIRHLVVFVGSFLAVLLAVRLARHSIRQVLRAGGFHLAAEGRLGMSRSVVGGWGASGPCLTPAR